MRVVGIDHGERRIGLAIADLETGMAFARPALKRRSLDHDLERIGELCASEGASRVVVGLPLNMDGTEGAQAASARAFGDQLAGRGLEVVYEDERLSSWEAGQRLEEGGRRVDRAGGELDSAAARVILQQYLDARRPLAGHAPDPDDPEESA